MRIFLVFLLLSLFPPSAFAWKARVVGITDGDTLTVEPLSGGGHVIIRLHGIDAPERKQPYGNSARSFLFEVALYKQVNITGESKDRYGRTVAKVALLNGLSLQEALLSAGWAWVWPRYCKGCDEWEQLQEEAFMVQKGLWAEEAPTPPWEWRKGSRSR